MRTCVPRGAMHSDVHLTLYGAGAQNQRSSTGEILKLSHTSGERTGVVVEARGVKSARRRIRVIEAKPLRQIDEILLLRISVILLIPLVEVPRLKTVIRAILPPLAAAVMSYWARIPGFAN